MVRKKEWAETDEQRLHVIIKTQIEEKKETYKEDLEAGTNINLHNQLNER